MGLFQNALPFDSDVERATNEKNTSEDWGQIMEICDRVGHSTENAKDCLRSIVKRLNCTDPHIVIQAITLLDACASNCGKNFHLEIASREFENEIKKLVSHPQPKIAEKMKILLKKWVEGDFKNDSQLNLIPSLYNKLKSDGVDFSCLSELPKRSTVLSKDPNIVTNSQEEEDIAKAIELSLKENKAHSYASTSQNSPSTKKSNSLYPNMSSALSSSSTSEGRKVRALYDFEAAEDNELTFLTGEIIQVLDDSSESWWKGRNHRGEGLFPSSFVTADLSVEPEKFTKLENSNKKLVQFADEVEVKTIKKEPEEVEIDEQKLDRLIHLLHEADPQCGDSDPQEMLDLEEQATAMGPLIDAALEKVDRRHAQLTQLSADLVDAVNLYHTLMREPHQTPSNWTMRKMSQPMSVPSPHMYNTMPPQYIPAGPPGAYNPNMANDEYSVPMNMQNMGMPQYNMPPGYHPHQMPGHLQHPASHHQGPSGHLQGPPVPEQMSLPYQPQGYPPQTGPLSGQYGPSGSTGAPMNQQPQYAPQNGQHMM